MEFPPPSTASASPPSQSLPHSPRHNHKAGIALGAWAEPGAARAATRPMERRTGSIIQEGARELVPGEERGGRGDGSGGSCCGRVASASPYKGMWGNTYAPQAACSVRGGFAQGIPCIPSLVPLANNAPAGWVCPFGFALLILERGLK